MSKSNDSYYCRVCGLYLGYPPWGIDGDAPSYEICRCCGVEFGYEDTILLGVRYFREKWLDQGATWFDPKSRPSDWDLKKQLAQIPKEYL